MDAAVDSRTRVWSIVVNLLSVGDGRWKAYYLGRPCIARGAQARMVCPRLSKRFTQGQQWAEERRVRRRQDYWVI